MPPRLTLPCTELLSRYESGQNTTQLAEHYGCSPTTIANHLRACGAVLRSSRFRAIHVSEEMLRQLYLGERLPIAVIAARLGVSVSTINNRRRRYNIPVRSNRRLPNRGSSGTSARAGALGGWKKTDR